MRKITTLDNISEDLVATDLFEVVDISDDSMAESGTNKNISASQLANGLSRILSDRVSIVTSTSDNAVLISQSGGGNALLIRDEANDASPFVVNGIGNVGIGTQLPTEKLDVIGIVKATGFVGPLTGNSSTATALASPRTIAITGDITGTATSFDGTSNITISSSITAGSIINADINPSAAIAGTKIIPNFGSQSAIAGALTLNGSVSSYTVATLVNTSGVEVQLNANSNTEGNLRTVTNHPLTFWTNNTERVRISASGNVVVGKPNAALSTAIDSGSANPPPTLGVYGAGISSLAVCGVGPAIRSFGLAGTIDAPLANIDGYNFGGIVGFPWNGSSFTSYGTGGTASIFLTSKGAQTPTNGGSLITFGTTQENTVGAVERVRIDHTGNVGIGTQSPLERLNVVGGGEHAIARFVGPSLPVISKDDQGIVIQVTQGNSTVEKRGFIDFRNENDIAVTSINSVHFPDGSCDLAINATNVGSRTVSRRTEIMRLKGNGNVGIGTNPGARLTIASNAQQYDSAIVVLPVSHATSRRAGITLGGWILGQDINGDGVTDSFIIWDGARARMTFHGSGAVDNAIIRNVNNGSQYWYYNKSNIAGIISDERTKNTIQKINGAEALQYINRISPSTFISNGDTELQAGFIAQDLLENATTPDQKTTVNNHKTYDKDDPDCPILGVADRPLVAYLVAAMQEQQKMIDSLTLRLAALETPKP